MQKKKTNTTGETLVISCKLEMYEIVFAQNKETYGRSSIK